MISTESKNIKSHIQTLTDPIKVLYISTYVPRKCGLATFTKDLTNAINLINPLSLAKIVAMDNGDSSKINYPHEVLFRVKQEDWVTYKKVAAYINKSSEVDLVCIQHEFGIFGGENGERICDFIDLLKKPVVTTLHTVIRNPNEKQKLILRKICDKSKFLIVMIEAAEKVLGEVYGVNPSKVVVIHHGVPDFPILEANYWKRLLKLRDRTVMSSINLLSEGKGIEYALKSIPKIVKAIPNFLYLIIGETHPTYLKYLRKNYGFDKYRKNLEDMVKHLKIEKHVRFVNRYISLKKLISYIGVSDYYITPYLDPQQAASGSLAYAIGAGKLCISTPYLYAKEMLSGGRGILVPYRNSEKITESILRAQKNEKEKRMRESKTYEVGRRMTWNSIAHQYFHLFRHVVEQDSFDLE